MSVLLIRMLGLLFLMHAMARACVGRYCDSGNVDAELGLKITWLKLSAQ